MGLFDKLPWVVNAKREKELTNLAREIFGEQGIYKDDTYERAEEDDFNPSDFSLDVYDKMLNDGQVKAGLDMIKLAVVSKGFNVTGDTKETKKYADFVNEALELLDGNMESVIAEMLSALEYGYSATEKVWQYKDGKVTIKKMKTLDPYSVQAKTDRFGDILHVTQRVGTKEIKIPPEKIIWYAHQKRFGNVYGNSALRTVYRHWFIKDKMYRFANIAYERYGTPLLVGKVSDPKDVSKMKKLLSKINGMTGLAVSGEDEIKSVQGTNADFIGYIEHHDRKIMESMLVPPLILSTGRGQNGSYALSNNQFDVFMMRLESLQRDLKALLEEEVIRPMVDLNFPNAKAYPSFAFKPLADRDVEKLANVFEKMMNAQVIAPSEDWIREELGFPKMSDETKALMEEERRKKDEYAKTIAQAQNKNNPLEGAETKVNQEKGAGKDKDDEGKK